jgi:formate hydrogenlyase transcriptional activator
MLRVQCNAGPRATAAAHGRLRPPGRACVDDAGRDVYIHAMADESLLSNRTLPSDSVEQALVRAARTLTMSLKVADVCDAILDAIHDVFGAASSWILLHDASTASLTTASVRGLGSAAFDGLAVPADAGLLGLAFQSRRTVFVPAVTDEERWYDPARVRNSGLASVFMVPLIQRDQALGVVGLDSPRFSAERPPTQTDHARLEAFAAQAAIAVANARLYEASERDRRKLHALLLERRQLRGQVDHLEEAVRTAGAFGVIKGQDAAFTRVIEQAQLVAPGDTTVLLFGETGTGKELLARLVHQRSRRAQGPFVAVNCAALPDSLVESELFGHEKGAFTGALARKPGKFEIANRGTLFLDEIGDLPLEAQAKLLRVLQDGQVQRVGGTQAVPVDVRVIAATNRDLEAFVAERAFRADLFYRLHVFPIRIPPLRDRQQDIVLLARHFLEQFETKFRRPALSFSPGAIQRLRGHDWPGNVRELRNVIERAVILSKDKVVPADAIALPRAIHRPAAPRPSPEALPTETPDTLMAIERRAILAALEASNWRVSGPLGAGHSLGLKPTTLHARMKRLGIARPGAPDPSRK